jgi:hypothetical protein
MGVQSVLMAMAGLVKPGLILGVLVLCAACAGVASLDEGATATPGTGMERPSASHQAPREDDAGEGAMQTPPPDTAPLPTALTSQDGATPPEGHPKLDSALNGLLAAYRQSGMPGAQSLAGTRGIVLDEGRVQVELVLAEGAGDDAIPQVEAAGGEVQAQYGTRLQALVPLEALEPLAQRAEVLVIRQPRRGTP